MNTTDEPTKPTPINHGGPAFPTTGRDGNWRQLCDGMSLRDYFAGQAIAATYVFGPQAAVLAYKFADEMIAARNRET